MKKIFLIAWLVLLTAVVMGQQAKNVLVIFSDDQSFNTIHALGNKEVITPNLDRLVYDGLSFRQTHVMGGHQGAICIPSRIMLLTGRYINRLPNDGAVVPDSIISLPEVLRKKGYITFHAGKWHSDKASHSRMFSAGGPIFFGGMHFPDEGGQFHPIVYHFDPTGNYPDELKWKADTFSSELYANAVIRFLSSRKNQEQPFFCYLAFTSPHDPRTPPERFRNLYDYQKIKLPPNFIPRHPFNNGDLKVRDEKLLPDPRNPDSVKKEIALYYGMISEMDEQVGRVMQALEKNGLKENTIVIFAGDNGLAVGQHGLLGKQNLYEHSIRVPMIISGQGVPKNKQTESLTYLSDIAPTLYQYLGVEPPSTVEGKSFYSLFSNPAQKIRKQLYNVYGHWSRSIKTADGWKLIVYNVNGTKTVQLFNLRADPFEKNNLSGEKKYTLKVKALHQLLKKEMLDTHDNLDIDLPDWGRKKGQKAAGS